jgi:carboxyl-terminal processing protease
VQTILPLPNNQAVKLTTARYYTPGGRSIQAKGIAADIVVEDEATKALLREADLQHHLSVEDDKSTPGAPAGAKKPVEKIIAGPAAGQSATAPKIAGKGEAKKDDGKKDPAAKKEDVQLNAAIAHLKAQSAPAATAASSVAVPATR